MEKLWLMKLIKAEDIELDDGERDGVVQAILEDKKVIMVRNYLVMASAISMIIPKYGDSNIPPKPKKKYDHGMFDANGDAYDYDSNGDYYKIKPFNQKEIDEWEEQYGSGRKRLT